MSKNVIFCANGRGLRYNKNMTPSATSPALEPVSATVMGTARTVSKLTIFSTDKPG